MVDTVEVCYVANGVTMVGRFAAPDGPGPFPAVLVAHGAPGLDLHLQSRPEALAACGFAALAIDYHGGGRVLSEPAAIAAQMDEITSDVDRLRSIARVGFEVLLCQDVVDPCRVGALGYCFGAAVAMELARTGADLKAVVGFHPGLWSPRPADSSNIVGRVLMCIGADDPLASVDDRARFEEEMRTAGVDWQVNLYGGAKHRFTDPNAGAANNPALEFNPRAAERSWQAMLAIFDQTIR